MGVHGFRRFGRSKVRPDEVVEVADASLVEVIDRAHALVWHGLGLPPHATPGHLAPVMDGYDAEDAYDVEVATLSAHLATVEAFVHPVARRRLTTGHALVAAQRRRGRHLEQLMRLIEGRFYGDTHAAGMDVDRLQDDLMRHVKAYIDSERDLARRLDAALSRTHRLALLERYSAALKHAPTRPHPYVPHPRWMAGTMFRVCSVWDRALDLMDNRAVPGEPAPRRTTPLSLWNRYLLGSAQFEEAPRPGTANAPSEASRTSEPGTTNPGRGTPSS